MLPATIALTLRHSTTQARFGVVKGLERSTCRHRSLERTRGKPDIVGVTQSPKGSHRPRWGKVALVAQGSRAQGWNDFWPGCRQIRSEPY